MIYYDSEPDYEDFIEELNDHGLNRKLRDNILAGNKRVSALREPIGLVRPFGVDGALSSSFGCITSRPLYRPFKSVKIKTQGKWWD